jgi:predicted aldo/keto reductase-like oxidoreductase
MKRRDFLKSAAAAGVAGIASRAAFSDSATPTSSVEVPRRTLGHTGESVSVIGLGGYHIGVQSTEEESIRIVRSALDRGINFLDNCWDYNRGVSEVRMGLALQDGYRAKAFLMTKLDGRTRQAAEKQIDESLQRLKTDHIDLLQVHEVIRSEDPARVFAPGGAMEALLAAKKAGKIRYIGFTGHKSPAMHLNMLNVAAQHNFTFDAVQMPLNAMDAHYDSFEQKVLPVLTKQNIGVLAMKTMGGGIILRSNTVTPIECLHYAMSLPTSVVITGCESVERVDQAIAAAHSFPGFGEAQRAALLSKTAEAAKAGEFELYKTTHNFDGTFKNPQWLG